MAAAAASYPVAIVTGGAQGIGRGITSRLLKDGWFVTVVDKDQAGIDSAKQTFSDYGMTGMLLCVRGDVSKQATAKEVVRETIGAASDGGMPKRQLDLLVNNAGGGAFGVNFEDVTEDHWNNVIGANLSSCFFFSQAAAPHLEKTNGSIVNIGSTRAFQSEPNTEAYSASKGGVTALTHSMACSLAPRGINVNAVAPGWIDVSGPAHGPGREQQPISEEDKSQHFAGRVGTADDIVDAVLSLHRNKFICGQTIVVDGGMTKKMIYHE